jgi:hypothetical protein
MNALTPAELLEQFANPPTPYMDKLCVLAKQLREDADEEARYERRMQEQQDDCWAAIHAKAEAAE